MEASRSILSYYSKIVLARNCFWDFCKVLHPDYYKENRVHLYNLCQTLDDFYHGLLIAPNGKPCKKIMINMPPQHGKSRTLILFTQWILGKNHKERVILCSYNDSTAQDFSKYARDGIQKKKIDLGDIIFHDVFPDCLIKSGSGSYHKWALKGEHFNYMGAGVGGSITSKGATVLMIDDPIKSASEALNENALENLWTWYTSTFLSRVSAEGSAVGGEPMEIILMTRWAKNDPCGKLLSDVEMKNEWVVIRYEAYDRETDTMLCSDFLSKKRYSDLRRLMVPEIFMPNYHQVAIDSIGRLYKSFKTYDKLPMNDKGDRLMDGPIRCYIDTADQGDDYLCAISYLEYNEQIYILDVYYTKEGMEVTEPETAKFLLKNEVKICYIESNSGGRGYARSVKRILDEKYKGHRVVIRWFHQSQNKKSRIISHSAWIQENVFYPKNWNDRFPEYFEAMNTYSKEGTNTHDDAPDATTGCVEKKMSKVTFLK